MIAGFRALVGYVLLLALGGCSENSADSPISAAGGAAGAGAASTEAGTGGAAPSAGASGSSAGNMGGSAGGVAVDCSLAAAVPVSVAWSAVNSQAPEWYAGAEALTIADHVVYYQNEDGGWPKAVDMTRRDDPKARSTIDNRATTMQILFLARVFSASGCAGHGEAARAGIEYLLEAQYPSGGWPQEYPDPMGYHAHITFNDDAMVNVLRLLGSVSRHEAPYTFVDDVLAAAAGEAVDSGVECILNCQIVIDGKKTGWCAQHDAVTLEPALARTYELPSLSGSEGAGLLQFLMTIDDPSPDVREAVEGAAAWFEEVKLSGIKVVATVDASQPTGEDRIVVEDAAAPPIWARFYELGTNQPIFSSRCEVPECEDDPFYMRRYSLAEIENVRRVGFSWSGDWPADVLESVYTAWLARWAP
jgi:PelA/Pel-15E family pectate lyase